MKMIMMKLISKMGQEIQGTFDVNDVGRTKSTVSYVNQPTLFVGHYQTCKEYFNFGIRNTYLYE